MVLMLPNNDAVILNGVYFVICDQICIFEYFDVQNLHN